MVTSYEAVRAIFEKPPESRQDFEVGDLIPWFRKHISLFHGLKSDALYEIIKYAEFTTKKTGEVIIEQGAYGDCMYILLRGKVTVYHQYNKSDSDDRPSLLPTSGPNKSESLRHALGTFVTHIGPGMQFGEVALIKEDIRSASILTEDQSDIVIIHRELYNRSIKFLLELDFAEKTNFINEHPHFERLVPRYKKQMTMALHKKTILYDNLLQRQGDDADAIYYILRGELKIQMDPNRHQTQFPKLFQGTTPYSQLPGNSWHRNPAFASLSATVGHEEEDDDAATFRSGDRSIFQRQSASSSSSSPASAASASNSQNDRWTKQQSRTLETCLLGRNESIGEFELLLGLSTYIQSTTSTQKTEVLVLELKHFERILLRRNPRIVDSMKSGLDLRISARTICSPKVERSIPLLMRLRAMAEENAEEQKRREAARVSDQRRRRKSRQAEAAATTEDKTTTVPADLGRRPPAVGGSNLLPRAMIVKVDAAALTTGEVDGGANGSLGDMEDDGETSMTLTGSHMDTVADPLSSEEMLVDLEDRIGSFVRSISMMSASAAAALSSSTVGMHSRSQSPCKTERLRRAITPADGLIRPGVTVIFRPKSTMHPDDTSLINSRRHEMAKKKWRLQYYKLALTSVVPNFTDLPVDAKPKS